MDATGKILALLAAILVVAGAGVVVLTIQDAPVVCKIEYELNGGESNSDLNPVEYTVGETYRLYAATDDEYIFASWYLDKDLTKPCPSITSDMSGDLTLYASWTISLEGMGFTLSLHGSISDGYSDTINISGTENYKYLYYDADNGRYYMEYDYDLLYAGGALSEGSSGQEFYWSDEDSTTVWTYGGSESITTLNGVKECSVFIGTDPSGNVQKQWVGDGWIPYLIEYVSADGNTEITYVYVNNYVFDIDPDKEVSVYTDVGLSATGTGTYHPGDSVTLRVTESDGHSFKGWYDDSGAFLSSSKSYSIDVAGSDVTIYAVNDTDPDFIYESKSVVLKTCKELSSTARWSVYDEAKGKEVATLEGSSPSYTFDDVGTYTIFICSPDDGYHGFYNAEVFGDVIRTFTWEHGNKHYSYDLTIAYSDYKKYVDRYDVSERRHISADHDRSFVTVSDRYIQRIACDFKTMTSGFSDLKVANFVLAFTQYIDYQVDDVYMGAEEYWKFPLETLYSKGGDCEDTSILFCTIVKAMGYDTCMLLFPGHMAAGISVDNGKGSYFSAGDVRYFYGETTGTGYDIGEIPSLVKGMRAEIIEVH